MVDFCVLLYKLCFFLVSQNVLWCPSSNKRNYRKVKKLTRKKRWHYKIRSELAKESSIKGMSRQVLFVVTFSTHNTNDTFGRDFQTPNEMSNKRTVGEFQTFDLLFRYVILWEKVCRLRFKVNQMTKGKRDYCGQ